jgi:hypothetical protein
MSTIKEISQKVSMLYSRHQDKENTNTNLDWREVKSHLVPIINTVMGATTVRLSDPDTGISITSGMAFRYNLPVLNRDLGNGTEYYVKLPVYPIRLRHELGIYRIGPKSPLAKPFVIIPSLYWDTLGGLAGFEGNICAIPLLNNEVAFSENPVETNVTATLIVSDSDQFGDDDVIPIPSDMEWSIITQVLKIFLPQVVLDKDLEAEVKAKENAND